MGGVQNSRHIIWGSLIIYGLGGRQDADIAITNFLTLVTIAYLLETFDHMKVIKLSLKAS